MRDQFGDRVRIGQRRDLPHQVIIRSPGALGFGSPAARFAFNHIGLAVPIAPARAAGLCQAFQRGIVNGQARRGMVDGKPAFEGLVGADQPPGPIGDRHATIGPVNRGDGHRPVWQGIFDFLDRGLGPREQPGQAAQCDQPPGKGCKDQHFAGGQPDHAQADRKGRAQDQPLTPTCLLAGARRAHGWAGSCIWRWAISRSCAERRLRRTQLFQVNAATR